MPRKRKIATSARDSQSTTQDTTTRHGPMFFIMNNAQMNEAQHPKYVKEMQQLYEKMDHDAFVFTFINMIKSAMAMEESNEFANYSLKFCAKFITSYDDAKAHPVLDSVFKWLLSTSSQDPHIRNRLCQFVNTILNALGLDAALEDAICDSILAYMIQRLTDVNPNVRVQAIKALQRLQTPLDPDDIVVKTYQFHLSSDPSPRVRLAVISALGRNYHTIPFVIERLWDIDEKVRRLTYVHMSSYPVHSYKVVQRVTFLEQGLNDRSDSVRRAVTTIMLPQWFQSYEKDYIKLICALKMDATNEEMDRFRKITKMALREIFKRQKLEDVIANLPLTENNEDEFNRCIPIADLTVENSLFWLCLVEYLQDIMVDEIDLIIPELSVFCAYVLKYCETCKFEMDKWQKMENQYIILTLMEIIYTYDLGDEIGRNQLKQLLKTILENYDVEQHTVQVIVKCGENLIEQQDVRLQFFTDIIKEISLSKTIRISDYPNDRKAFEELLEKQPDKSLKLKFSSLKVKFLDLKEQEMNFVEKKDYVQAQKIAEEINACNNEYHNLLKPLLDKLPQSSDSSDSRKSLTKSLQQMKGITTECIVKCLHVAFYMVASKKVKSLTPHVCELYKDFIRRHIESSHIIVREWALRCGTAYSMLYDQLSKDVYSELFAQFYKNHDGTIWKTAVECIFELLDRYGFAQFESEDKTDKNAKTGRLLYKTLDLVDSEEEVVSAGPGCGLDVVFMMSHFFDTCDDLQILLAIVKGFSRLILHGHIKNDCIMGKLLIKYFNPGTDSEINQMLGVFFDNLIHKKKQEYLQPCLLPTLLTILNAPYDSPLQEIKPQTVLRFVIDSTRPIYCSSGLNIHNTIALSFMQEIENNSSNNNLVRILSKELTTLEISIDDDESLRRDLQKCCDELLANARDNKIKTNLQNFREILDGNAPVNRRSINGDNSEEELEQSDDETETNIQENCEKSNQMKELEEQTQNQDNSQTDIEKSLEKSMENCSVTETNPNQSTISETTNSSILHLSGTTENKGDSVEHVTPTTYGRNNTTTMRYLRKSLNTQRATTDEDSPLPPKIRIQARSATKKTDKRMEDETSDDDEDIPTNKTTIEDSDEEIPKTPEPNKRRAKKNSPKRKESSPKYRLRSTKTTNATEPTKPKASSSVRTRNTQLPSTSKGAISKNLEAVQKRILKGKKPVIMLRKVDSPPKTRSTSKKDNEQNSNRKLRKRIPKDDE